MMAWGRRPVKRGLVDLRHLSRQSRLAAGKMSKVNEINVTIKDNKVVVYSKTYCPFCTMAKDALGDAGLKDYLVIELDKIESGDAYQDALKEITGGRTVGSSVFFYQL